MVLHNLTATTTTYPVQSHKVGSGEGKVECMQTLPLHLRGREVVSERHSAQVIQINRTKRRSLDDVYHLA